MGCFDGAGVADGVGLAEGVGLLNRVGLADGPGVGLGGGFVAVGLASGLTWPLPVDVALEKTGSNAAIPKPATTRMRAATVKPTMKRRPGCIETGEPLACPLGDWHESSPRSRA